MPNSKCSLLTSAVRLSRCNGESYVQCACMEPSHCLQHEDSLVELQALSYSQQQKRYRVFYRCVAGKKSGQRWCGSVPWTTPANEKTQPLSEIQLPQSCLPPVRNPFKTVSKANQPCEQTSNQRGEREQTEKSEKDNMDTKIAEKQEPAESYKGKPLPPGMRVKKRVSDEDSHHPKSQHREKEDQSQQQAETIHSDHSPVEDFIPPASSETAHPRKSDQTSSDDSKTLAQMSASSSARSSDASGKPVVSEPTTTKPDDDSDDVILVSVKPSTQKTPPVAGVQKPITAFPGFQKASQPKGMTALLLSQLQQKKAVLSSVNVEALPDKGERLKTQVKELETALESLSLTAASQSEASGTATIDVPQKSSYVNPFSRPGGTIMLPAAPAVCYSQQQASSSSGGLELTQGYSQSFGANPQGHTFYGGRMTDDRLLAVKNATCEAIDNLHKSLETSPGPEAEVSDPKGIKVTLLPHQRRALAWLQWRETQSPCGGILADDMGLGKTLTMIALILSAKIRTMEKTKGETGKKADMWLSKKDSRRVDSKATLIICPASLVHHWKNEIDRHVKAGKLSVYLYHGPNRERSAKSLAEHDVVVTTYSLVSKEAPVQKEEAEKPPKETDSVPSNSGPLMQVAWARVVLDEAHNIKNPKVQTSMAVCQLTSDARWAVTGTPIQNNLLDMFSLLKFLKCSPFDEYKLWKAQVDNGSKRGRERLNILTRTLLLRRTKEENDSTGKPLVSLPDRTCNVHQLKLSEDEQQVYDVLFAQSRSTLQNYLKRHEEKDLNKGGASTPNPFDKVAQEFGMSQADPSLSCSQQPQQASSTVHILSLLLRLRQSCCHLSLLKKTLDSSELQGDGIVLSLEEQLNALSLSSSPSQTDNSPQDSVSLNGSRFPAQIFEKNSRSTKVSAILSELKAIQSRGTSEKSVIVSQWTSMLQIVAVHLIQMDLKYAVIDGTVNPKKRMDLVEEFNTNPKGPQVMLVSLCAGGVGLNLVGGNHLFLIDMHWNPALEDQACDRIYRVGQRRDVTVHRFVCEGTVEEKISTLQQKKKELAQNVLSGTGSTFTKLSLADLRIIFGV
ncbi:transcription termination factor 2 isoform X2 [Synchiropus splendidus]|uniref:transcription termination factor 2 isoform X2 n=1 Tax=Synchiropus splendidus TaxID=270530 RepID=UPI00237E3F2B|nr:transcription termination factor 2 isoform X2 [Synchiropus splendidus]